MRTPYAYFLVQGKAFPDLSTLIRAAEATSRRMKAGRRLKLALRGMPWGVEDDASPRSTELLGGVEVTTQGVALSDIEPGEGLHTPPPRVRTGVAAETHRHQPARRQPLRDGGDSRKTRACERREGP